MGEGDPARKSEVGEDLIRAIFGSGGDCRRSASLVCLARCGNTFWNASPERAITLEDQQRLRSRVELNRRRLRATGTRTSAPSSFVARASNPKTSPQEGDETIWDAAMNECPQ